MIKFDFNENYILEDDFIKLSPLKIEHAETLLDIANQTDIWKYSFSKGNGIENLNKYIQSTINNRNAETEYPFIVFDKIQNKYAGSTRLYDVIPSLDSLRIGYTWYGEEHRGTKELSVFLKGTGRYPRRYDK
jgi:RimJ/RimL family protein N-acetyltransferase